MRCAIALTKRTFQFNTIGKNKMAGEETCEVQSRVGHLQWGHTTCMVTMVTMVTLVIFVTIAVIV
jgi:hypothetical protein